MSDAIASTETLPERCPGCDQRFNGWKELYAHTTTCAEYRSMWIRANFGGNPPLCGHLDLSMDWKGDLRPQKEGSQPTSNVWLAFHAIQTCLDPIRAEMLPGPEEHWRLPKPTLTTSGANRRH